MNYHVLHHHQIPCNYSHSPLWLYYPGSCIFFYNKAQNWDIFRSTLLGLKLDTNVDNQIQRCNSERWNEKHGMNMGDAENNIAIKIPSTDIIPWKKIWLSIEGIRHKLPVLSYCIYYKNKRNTNKLVTSVII